MALHPQTLTKGAKWELHLKKEGIRSLSPYTEWNPFHISKLRPPCSLLYKGILHLFCPFASKHPRKSLVHPDPFWDCVDIKSCPFCRWLFFPNGEMLLFIFLTFFGQLNPTTQFRRSKSGRTRDGTPYLGISLQIVKCCFRMF